SDTVSGSVELAGTVVEHDGGYRAGLARPVELMPPLGGERPPVEHPSIVYGVPIRPGGVSGLLGGTGAGGRNEIGWRLRDRDATEAEHWYRRAIDGGDTLAMSNLGFLIQDRDPVEAERWYRKAAWAREPWGMNNLGWVLCDRDPAEARVWLA